MSAVLNKTVITAIHIEDLELARRAMARDGEAFRLIMQTHNRGLFRIARGIIRNDGEAEDIIQEAYVSAFVHLEKFRGEFFACNVAVPDRHQRSFGPTAQKAACVRFCNSNRYGATGGHHSIPPQHKRRSGADDGAATDAADGGTGDRQLTGHLSHCFYCPGNRRTEPGRNRRTSRYPSATAKTRLHRARTLVRKELEGQIGPVLMDAFPFAGRRCARLTAAVMQRIGFPD